MTADASPRRPGQPGAQPVQRELCASDAARARARTHIVASTAVLASAALAGAVLTTTSALPSPAPAAAAAALGVLVVSSVWSLHAGLKAERAAGAARVELERLQSLLQAATLRRQVPQRHPFRGSSESIEEPVDARTRPPLGGSRALVAIAAAAAVAVLLVGVITLLPGGGSTIERRWTFTEEIGDLSALGLTAPIEEAGAWELSSHEHATGGRALSNRAGSGAVPAILVAPSLRAEDVRVTTRCRASADVARACGVVFRYRDPSSYYVARVDNDEQAIVLARVSRGEEQVLGLVRFDHAAAGWHELVVEAEDRALRVDWNGTRVINHQDDAPKTAGAVGLWVPAAGAAHFDELSVRTLGVASEDDALIPLVVRPRAS
ncbi:MAG: hypothetical protein IPG04_06490 [Polyangiaceae bacterium]|jgi:hypothetical protein|nr:hypothetical protein [Polyangiaceae bacterium]